MAVTPTSSRSRSTSSATRARAFSVFFSVLVEFCFREKRGKKKGEFSFRFSRGVFLNFFPFLKLEKKNHLFPFFYLARPASPPPAACLAFQLLHSSSPSTLLASSSVLSPLEENARRFSCVAASRLAVGRLAQPRQQRRVRPFRVEPYRAVGRARDDGHAGALGGELERVEELVDYVVALDLEGRRRWKEEEEKEEVERFSKSSRKKKRGEKKQKNFGKKTKSLFLPAE